MDEKLFSEFPKEFTETFLANCDAPAPAAAFVGSLERQLVERQQKDPKGFRDSLTGPRSAKPLGSGRFAPATWLSRHRWKFAVLVLGVCLGAGLLAIGPQRVVAQIQTWLGYLPGAGFVIADQTRVLAAPFEARQGNSTLVVEQVIAGPEKTIVVVKLTSTPEEINRQMVWGAMVTLILPNGLRFTSQQFSEQNSSGQLSAEMEYPPLPAGMERVTLEMPKLPISNSRDQEYWSVNVPLQTVRQALVQGGISAAQGTALPGNLAIAPYTPKNGQTVNQGVTVHVLQVGQSAQETGVLLEIDWSDSTWDYLGSGAELRDNLGKYYPLMKPLPGSNSAAFGIPRGMTTAQEMLRFPALDPGVQQVTLILNTMNFEIHPQAQFQFDPGKFPSLDQTWSFAGDASKRLEIAGFQVQVLQADLAYAPYSDQVTVVNPPSATALPGFACRLEFVLQVTQQTHAQLFPGGWKQVGGDLGPSGASSVGDAGRVTISLDLPELPTTPLTIQLNDANLMLEGGWQIRWDLTMGAP